MPNKEMVRKKHSLYGSREIEIHHEPPRYERCPAEKQKFIPVTKPEHAIKHYELFELADLPKIRNYNAEAVDAIFNRMNLTEKFEFCEMLEMRKR